MAVTFALAQASNHCLKYRVTSGGAESGSIDAAGSTTPDLLTDAYLTLGNLYNALALAVTTQAEGRTLAFDGTNLEITITPRNTAAVWTIDANTDGSSHLRLTMTASGIDATGCYLNIRYRHSTVA